AREGQDCQRRDRQVAYCRKQQQFSPVEKIRQGASKQSEAKQWNSLSEPGEAELKRRAGQFVNLVKILREPHLLRRSYKDRNNEEQPIIAKSQGGPGANGTAALVRFERIQ